MVDKLKNGVNSIKSGRWVVSVCRNKSPMSKVIGLNVLVFFFTDLFFDSARAARSGETLSGAFIWMNKLQNRGSAPFSLRPGQRGRVRRISSLQTINNVRTNRSNTNTNRKSRDALCWTDVESLADLIDPCSLNTTAQVALDKSVS